MFSELEPINKFRDLVKLLVAYLERRGVSGVSLTVIDRNTVAAVVAEQTRDEDDVKQESVAVVSSFKLPRYSYDVSLNTYRYIGDTFPLHGDATGKLAIFEERLALVRARLLRQKDFQVPLPGVKRKYHKLTRVDDLSALESSNDELRTIMMLGVLTQAEEGLFCLEDGSGSSVALDLTHVKELCSGLFTESCIVLVQGTYFPEEEARLANKEEEEEENDDNKIVERVRKSETPSSSSSLSENVNTSTLLDITMSSEAPQVSFDSLDHDVKTGIYMGVGGKGRSTVGRFSTGRGVGGGGHSTACYSCGLEGHRSSECPTKVSKRAEGSDGVEAVSKYGNKWKGGRKTSGHDDQGQGSSSSSSSLNQASDSPSFSSSSFKPFTDERIRGLVKVRVLGFPPIETRDVTLRAMAIVDPLRALHSPAELVNIKRLMQTSPDVQSTTLSIFSDVHLDKPDVLENLRKVLVSDSKLHNPSALYIFMGNFSSRPLNEILSNQAAYRAGFDALASLLTDFPDITAKSRFVFVPGPCDPGAANVLPRPPLPSSLVKSFINNDAIPHVTFTSNPARIRFYSQEMVLYREDLTIRLRRRAILTPLYSKDGETRPVHGTRHMSETVLHQGHLCPLPLSAQPIFWELDYTLRLSPLPELIVIAEDEEQFSYEYFSSETFEQGANSALATVVLNPGSFGTQCDFSVICPAKIESWATHNSLDNIVTHMCVKEDQNEQGRGGDEVIG